MACFDEANDFPMDGDKDRSGWRRRKFDDDFLREGMTFAINFGRHDFAAHTFFLPTGREGTAAGDFFGEAGWKAFAFLCGDVPGLDVGADHFAFGIADADVDADPGIFVFDNLRGMRRLSGHFDLRCSSGGVELRCGGKGFDFRRFDRVRLGGLTFVVFGRLVFRKNGSGSEETGDDCAGCKCLIFHILRLFASFWSVLGRNAVVLVSRGCALNERRASAIEGDACDEGWS